MPGAVVSIRAAFFLTEWRRGCLQEGASNVLSEIYERNQTHLPAPRDECRSRTRAAQCGRSFQRSESLFPRGPEDNILNQSNNIDQTQRQDSRAHTALTYAANYS